MLPSRTEYLNHKTKPCWWEYSCYYTYYLIVAVFQSPRHAPGPLVLGAVQTGRRRRLWRLKALSHSSPSHLKPQLCLKPLGFCLMGAANGEVIREPFDTKPSDQWVGCLLISLRSKGVARRSCMVGHREMLCEWVDETGPGPCLCHRAPCVRIWLGIITLVPCPGAHWGLVGISLTPLRCHASGDVDCQG